MVRDSLKTGKPEIASLFVVGTVTLTPMIDFVIATATVTVAREEAASAVVVKLTKIAMVGVL